MKLFSKLLTSTDCLKRLSIPNKILSSLPDFHGGHVAELQVQFENMEWRVGCSIRKKGNYKKPVLSRDWRKFVIGNRLNVGDEFTLYKEEDETGAIHYRAEVKRRTGQAMALPQNPRSCENIEDDQKKKSSVQMSNYCSNDQTSSASYGTCHSDNVGMREVKLFGVIIVTNTFVVDSSNHEAGH